MTEETVLNSLIKILDDRVGDGRRLDTLYREFSKVRNFDTALAFIQNLQSRQQFHVRQVFLNRVEFLAYRARALKEANANRLPLDYSFTNKGEKLEFSFSGKS